LKPCISQPAGDQIAAAWLGTAEVPALSEHWNELTRFFLSNELLRPMLSDAGLQA
jgi:hypothetical protein